MLNFNIKMGTLVALATLLSTTLAGEASVLLCSSGVSGNPMGAAQSCGVFYTYTDGTTRQSVSASGGSPLTCAYKYLRKQTNDAGFWGNLDIVGDQKGATIGSDRTGKEINLSSRQPRSVNRDAAYLKARCVNEFDAFDGDIDPDPTSSSELFYTDLENIL